MLKISYSRVDSYLSCPYSHYLRYIEGLSFNRPVRPLSFGSDMHKLLEHRNDKAALKEAKKEIKSKYYELPGSWQSDLGEDYLADLSCIFSDYRKIYKHDPQPQITEHQFEILLGKFKDEPIFFVGVIDELYLYKRSGTKFINVGEHKTFSQKPDMNVLVMNAQKCLYAKATQLERGILPEKVIWDYIKSTPAAMPIWLEKSKRFSEAQTQSITPLSWERACKLKGIDEPEEIAKGQRYSGNIPNFFFKVAMDIIPDMVEDVFEGFVYTCKEIAKQGHKNKTKHVTRDCGWCNFRDICFTEFTGGDREYVVNKNYIQKDRER